MLKQQQFIKLIKRLATSVVKQYNLPMTLHDLAAVYTKSPEFLAIYNYIKEDKIVRNSARRQIQERAVDYILINNLLFKMVIDCFGEDALVLCIPRKYIPMVLYQYHDMIMAGHQGPIRTLKTLSRKFFISKAMLYIQKYIRTC